MQTLNSLQSNAAVLQRIRQQRGFTNNIHATEGFLDKVGISLKDLDSLSVIHIAGKIMDLYMTGLFSVVCRSFVYGYKLLSWSQLILSFV